MAMRITTKMMQSTSLNNLNTNKALQEKLTTQLSTMKKITRPSDDPVIAIRSLKLNASLNKIDQYYEKNSEDAESWLELTESAIKTTNDIITNMRTYVVQASNGDLTADDRKSITENLTNLKTEVYSTGNADSAGRSLFTGYRTDLPLTFNEDKEERYTITEQRTNSILDTTTFVRTGDLASINEGNFTTKSTTEYDVGSYEISRIRLAYANVDFKDDDTVLNLSYDDGNGNFVTPTALQNSQIYYFESGSDEAYQQALAEDPYYNDSTFNVTYVDSHDYAPDNAPENARYNGNTETWAENLSLIFTFRGIPCIYYGSEVEFQKGMIIDPGPTKALAETGRAYFGDCIEGSVDVADFGRYTNATGAMAETLNNPLSLHIQRLNRLRAAIPALRKGQYSTEGCSGSFAYKRRYTDSTTDSFALIALSSDATFSGIPNGKYTDAITGDVKNVANGTLSTSGIKGQGDLRVYVLDTELTKAPGMIDGYSKFMSGGCDLNINVVAPTGVTLDKTSAELDLGDTVTFTATVAPADATNKSVSWASSDASVATVSNGKVTAKGAGESG